MLTSVEICAGAGGQALGLELAGFSHLLAVELDQQAALTLEANRPWKVAVGDVADRSVWRPEDYRSESEPLDLFAGGVPCPPFSIAGQQKGARDERDLFAWAVEQIGVMQPRALLLENVRGLSGSRFAGYRQHVLDRLAEFGYWAEWRLLNASDFGVPQLRPRFVLVALKPEDAAFFEWPQPHREAPTVGEALSGLMSEGGWELAESWALGANRIAPTIVGGSKKHGGADLGPTRAKAAWREIGVDAMGVADRPPGPGAHHQPGWAGPRLTTEMVARLQGWEGSSDYKWTFTGRKTSRYRQIGNAFPPPVARAVGGSIARALGQEGVPVRSLESLDRSIHDQVYRVLSSQADYVSATQIVDLTDGTYSPAEVQGRLKILARDFEIEVRGSGLSARYLLRGFGGFVGQEDHGRHEQFARMRSRIS